MKNKFLVMAVMTSLVAALMAPAVFADESPVVSANIQDGTFTLVGNGIYNGSAAIALDGLGAPPVVQTNSSKTATYNASATLDDSFVLTDSLPADGARVLVKMSSAGVNANGQTGTGGDFVYIGSSALQGLIPSSKFFLIPQLTAGAKSAPVVSNTAGAAITFAVSQAASAPGAKGSAVLTNYQFPDIGDNDFGMTGVNQTYFRSSSSAPLVGTLRLDKLLLQVPAGTNSGDYASTLVITAVPGHNL